MNDTLKFALDRQGRILIPASTRKRLGLKSGMTLVVEKGMRGGVLLRVQDMDPRIVNKRGVWVIAAKPLSDMNDRVHQDRAERIKKLTGRLAR